MANVQMRSDGHAYYVIGGTSASEGTDWVYKSNGKYYVDAGASTLNLIGGHVLVNGVDLSNVMIGDITEYAKKTEVTSAINASWAAVNANFRVGSTGSVWIRTFDESIKKLPSNYTSLKAVVNKVNAVLEALGSKVGVVDATLPALNGEKIEAMQKMFFIKVNKMITTYPVTGTKYYVKNGNTYVEGGTVDNDDEDTKTVHPKVWAGGVDVYGNENPSTHAGIEDIEWNEIDIISHLCAIDDKLNKIIEVVNAYIG